MKKLIVQWDDQHVNMPVTHVQREGDILFAFFQGLLIGMFDLMDEVSPDYAEAHRC